MNKEQTKAIEDLRRELEEIIKTNTYGLVKVKNVVCSRTDLENLYFITGLLKSGYSASSINESILTDAVKKVLSKTKIDLALGNDYIEKKLKEKEKQIEERTKTRKQFSKQIDALISKDTLDSTLNTYNLKETYEKQKEVSELLNGEDAIEGIREAFKELFSREEITLEEHKRIIDDFFKYARDFITDKVKLVMLDKLEEEIKETYLK